MFFKYWEGRDLDTGVAFCWGFRQVEQKLEETFGELNLGCAISSSSVINYEGAGHHETCAPLIKDLMEFFREDLTLMDFYGYFILIFIIICGPDNWNLINVLDKIVLKYQEFYTLVISVNLVNKASVSWSQITIHDVITLC